MKVHASKQAHSLSVEEESRQFIHNEVTALAKKVSRTKTISDEDQREFESLSEQFLLCESCFTGKEIKQKREIENSLKVIGDIAHAQFASSEEDDDVIVTSPAKRKKENHPLADPTIEGIHNVRNNCCYISAYQLLSRIPGIMDLLPEQLKDWKNFKNTKRIRLEDQPDALNGAVLRKAVQKLPNATISLQAHKQEDAAEIILNVLNPFEYPHKLHAKNITTYDLSNVPKQQRAFCEKVTQAQDDQSIINLPLRSQKTHTFQGTLENFFRLDPVEIKQMGVMTPSVQRKKEICGELPTELIFTFDRFTPTGEYDGEAPIFAKNTTKIKGLPTYHRFKPSHLNKDAQNDKEYELKGAILHHGEEAGSGHYTTLVKADNGVWHHLDDDYVKVVSEEKKNALLEDAYVLHYSATPTIVID